MQLSILLSKKDCIVDIQGFHLPNYGFIMKEIAILSDQHMHHWIFLLPTFIKEINRCDEWKIEWTSRYYHQIPWKTGFEKYEDAKKLIETALENTDIIYVKGVQKGEWLKNILNNNNLKIKNIEEYDCKFSLKEENAYRFSCNFHYEVCSVYNVFKIACWFDNTKSI